MQRFSHLFESRTPHSAAHRMSLGFIKNTSSNKHCCGQSVSFAGVLHFSRCYSESRPSGANTKPWWNQAFHGQLDRDARLRMSRPVTSPTTMTLGLADGRECRRPVTRNAIRLPTLAALQMLVSARSEDRLPEQAPPASPKTSNFVPKHHFPDDNDIKLQGQTVNICRSDLGYDASPRLVQS